MEHLRLKSQLMRQGRLRSTHLDHLKSEEIKEISCQNIYCYNIIIRLVNFKKLTFVLKDPPTLCQGMP